jgi:hypothetical protein
MTFLPESDRQYLANKGYVYEEITEGKLKGLIFSKFKLPPQKYDVSQVDLLILLPNGYPDIVPDMFYLEPSVKLVQENRPPRATQARQQFNGRSWQRWSRHNQEWRRGVDGIWTMLKRVEHALEVAA